MLKQKDLPECTMHYDGFKGAAVLEVPIVGRDGRPTTLDSR